MKNNQSSYTRLAVKISGNYFELKLDGFLFFFPISELSGHNLCITAFAILHGVDEKTVRKIGDMLAGKVVPDMKKKQVRLFFIYYSFLIERAKSFR